MKEEKVETQIVSFNEVKNNIIIEHDDYNIARDGMKEQLVKVIFSNPFLIHYDRPMFLFSRYNGIVGGRVMYYPTKLMLNGETQDALIGSDLKVEESLRQHALGLDLMLYATQQQLYSYTLYAGLSPMAVRIYKHAPETTIFETPKMCQFRNVRLLLHRFGIKGKWLNVMSLIPNFFLQLYIILLSCIFTIKRKGYRLKKMETIPRWVDDMLLNDGYKYKELHNCDWMQWVLDHDFWPNKKNRNEFVAIYKNQQPVGFFLIKVRCIEKYKGLKDVKKGSIFEWGTIDENILSEETIIKMAVSSFSKDIDFCQFTSKDTAITQKFKWYGFIEKEKSYIVFRDLGKRFEDSKDINNWRIRLGYADTVFY